MDSNSPKPLTLEIWRADYTFCQFCDALAILDVGERYTVCPGCNRTIAHDALADTRSGWFFWYCFPGCLPDSDPYGPYQTHDEALRECRALSNDDLPTEDQ